MRKEERLLRLYERLPKLECKGLCSESCGPIPLFGVEAARIVRIHGKHVKTIVENDLTCSMLTESGRCSIYADRPLICRLWGMVKGMECPYGCQPEGGVLSDAVGRHLIRELSRIDGESAQVDMGEKDG